MLEFERQKQSEGYRLVAGMDEAGRGPLAGPVFVAMCIMPLDEDKIIAGVDDSKKLSPKARLELYGKIKKVATSYIVNMVDEKTIDEINILEATKLGMRMCLDDIDIKPDYVLVDFIPKLQLKVPFKTIIKGDSLSYSIACASILAKVERDMYMEELDKIYPEYSFAKHKGYGTRQHYEMLKKYGSSPVHRKTFLKKFEEYLADDGK